MNRVRLGVFSVVLAALFAFAGCSTSPKTSGAASLARETLLPQGTYRHRVALTVKLPAGPREFTLDGVVAINASEIQVLGLSLFGTTEFRVTDALDSNQVSVEVYRDALKRSENKIREYYSTLKLFLTAKATADREKILVWAETNASGQPTLLTVPNAATEFKPSAYDKNGIPMELEITSEAFNARIKVTSYEI